MATSSAEPAPASRCAVLAGGRGARLGGSKCAVELGGRPLISYPLAAAAAAGLDPLVVAKRSSPLPALDAEILLEDERPHHPLLGIATALAAVAAPVVACPCDSPLVPAELLRWLALRRDPLAVIAIDGAVQPLIGRYTPGLERDLRDAVARGRSAVDAVEALGAVVVGGGELRRFGDPALIGVNVNTPEQLEAAEAAIG